MIDRRRRGLAWALTIGALLYSVAHFAQAGVLFPLHQQNLAKYDEETPALRNHLQSGEPVHFDNQVQYGPVFFFVVHPLMAARVSRAAFSNSMYALQLVCVGLAFGFTIATVAPLVRAPDRPMVFAWLTVLWLTFSPLYTILTVKSVETWELALLAAALYAHLRGWSWTMAFALAAAALVKVLPLIFFAYLLFTDRRAFARAVAALVALLAVSQALYGPDMGAMYFPKIFRSATGASFGLLWHENLSLKAAIAKTIGHLDIPAGDRGGSTLVMTDAQIKLASRLGDAATLAGLAWLMWSWIVRRGRTSAIVLWEWSMATAAMLILAPNSTYEYATLALGAISYAIVRAVYVRAASRTVTWTVLGIAMFLLGVLVPRAVQNRVTFVDALRRWSGYSHLTSSEAYQYYCFPLIGLFLLALSLWMLRPAEAASIPAS